MDVLAPALLSAQWRVYRAWMALDYAMRLAAERGDWEGVERYARAGFALSRLPMRSACLMSGLQMQTHRMRVLRALCRVSAEQCMPGDVCRRMAELVRMEGMDEGEIGEMWRGERMYGSAYLRGLHNRHGMLMVWKLERMAPDEMTFAPPDPESVSAAQRLWERVWNVRAYFEPRIDETARVGEEIARVCEEWMLGLPGSAGEDVGEVRGMAENLLLRGSESLLTEGLFSTITASEAMGRMWVRDERAAVISLLVSAYRAERGEWPSMLKEAMPAEETVDPVTGKPFVYRLLRNHVGVFELYAPEGARGLLGRAPYGATWRSPRVRD